MKPFIGITLGDFNGIGPEVALKALRASIVRQSCEPILIGSTEVYEWYARRMKMKLFLREVDRFPFRSENGIIPILPLQSFRFPNIIPGAITKEAGEYAGESIETAAGLCRRGMIDAMVTAPSSKKTLDMAGYHYPGQTEMLSKLSGNNRVMMLLVADKFRVGLATVHLPLKDVAKSIDATLLREKIRILLESLKKDFRIKRPRIAVLGVNPHAGENGILGNEEDHTVIPVLKQFRLKGISVDGPFPADGFFGIGMHNKYDAILAMYHDQGLIPLKFAGFDKGVNYSAGLKIVRTSPDHGTGFDIAGKGIANPNSMIEAILLAGRISLNRKKTTKL